MNIFLNSRLIIDGLSFSSGFVGHITETFNAADAFPEGANIPDNVPLRIVLSSGRVVISELDSLLRLLPRLGRNDARTRGGSGVLRSFAKRTHSPINRWVLKSAPELDKRIRSFLNPPHDSWRVDETYIKIKGKWKYLYRAIDSEGNTLDFMLSAKRNGKTAARFFLQSVGSKAHSSFMGERYSHCEALTVDKNAAYSVAINELKQDKTLKAETELRQSKYLNNIVEQDHRNVKRIGKPMMGFQSFNEREENSERN